jgi:hypothetical protein
VSPCKAAWALSSSGWITPIYSMLLDAISSIMQICWYALLAWCPCLLVRKHCEKCTQIPDMLPVSAPCQNTAYSWSQRSAAVIRQQRSNSFKAVKWYKKGSFFLRCVTRQSK